MSKYKFTIITVCYNAEKFIAETIKSVLSQTYADYQYIIKDGMSCDKTMEIVHGLTASDNRVMMIQDNDRGIYDAMNIAISQAEGEYVLFLNAGDKFANANVLQHVSDYMLHSGADILYGDVSEVYEDGQYLRKYTEKNSKMWYYSLGACLCHQTMFCRRNMFQEKLFNLQYKVCADRDWQMYHLKNGRTAKPLNFQVAEVLADGFSKEHIDDLIKEIDCCVKQYCGAWYQLYKLIMFCKKNKFICSLIQKTEKLISCK